MATAALTVDLNARIAQFETEMKRATGTLDKFGKRGDAVAAGLKGAFAGLAAGLSVGALASFAKSGIDAADSLNDMSVRLGVTVKDLASMQLVAEQSGTSLEGIGVGIAKLNKSSSEAAGGNDKLAASLLSLGVTASTPLERFYQLADAVNGMEDPTKRAADLSTVLGKNYLDLIPTLVQGGNALRDSAKASETFSDQMAKLAPNADQFNDNMATLKINAAGAAAALLNELVPALNRTFERLERLSKLRDAGASIMEIVTGGVSADTSSSLKRVTADVYELETTIARLRKNSGGKDQSILPLEAELKRLKSLRTGLQLLEVERIQAVKSSGMPATPSIGGDTGEQMACIADGGKWANGKCTPKKTGGGSKSDPQGAFVEKLRDEAATLGMGSEALKKYEASKLKLTGTNKKLAAGFIAQIAAFNDQKLAAEENNKAFDEAIKKQDDLDSALEGSIKSLREWLSEQQFEASLIGKTNAERETAIRLRAAEVAGIDTQTESYKKLKEQILAISETKQLDSLIAGADFSKLKQDQEDMILLTKAFTDGIVQADGSLRKLSEAEYLDAVTARLGIANEKIGEMDVFAKKAAENMQDAFADFLFDPFDKGMDGMLKGFGQTVQRMIAEAASAQLMKSLFGDLVKGGEGSGLAGDALKFIGSFFPSANGNVFNSPGLSAYSGSVVSKPTIFPFASGIGLMGEAGAEAILPLKRGSNGKLGVQGGGGSTIIVNVSGSNNAPDVRRAAGQGAREALGLMSGARRYG